VCDGAERERERREREKREKREERKREKDVEMRKVNYPFQLDLSCLAMEMGKLRRYQVFL
jgi:hypothetical protein